MQEDKPPPVAKLLDLTGHTALVTGASGNIGQGISRRLAEAGATVVAHYFENDTAAKRLAGEIGGRTVKADLRNERDVDAMFAAAIPDFVVNNAAVQPVKPLAEQSFADWQNVLHTNLDAAFLVTRRSAIAWRAAETRGAIVNIASIEGLDPATGHAHYAASKAALLMLTRACALEFGNGGIRVNAVSPGLIGRENLDDEWPDGVARWRARAPLARLGTANDVADAVLFLLSPAARWISGANLVVDGGMSARSRW